MLLSGVGTLRYFLILTNKWLLGAGFLRAPPISLILAGGLTLEKGGPILRCVPFPPGWEIDFGREVGVHTGLEGGREEVMAAMADHLGVADFPARL